MARSIRGPTSTSARPSWSWSTPEDAALTSARSKNLLPPLDGGASPGEGWWVAPTGGTDASSVRARRAARPHRVPSPPSRFWGTRIVSLVVVQRRDAVAVESWDDLVSVAENGGGAILDHTFAGSGFATLALFA